MKHPLIRYHGGKFRLADWIISHFPNHETYVEPFGGGGSVLLNKIPSHFEIYNDIDEDLVNFFRVLRDEEQSKRLIKQVDLTPYSRNEFVEAYKSTDDPVERARRLLIRAQMGFGGSCSIKYRTGFRTSAKRTGNTVCDIWSKQTSIINQAIERLKGVLIENRDALQIIQDHDSEETLFYLDPPYVLETRKPGNYGFVYGHEMTELDHERLIDLISTLKGKVILSGYDHPIYSKLKWKKVLKTVGASGQSGGVQREEILWINPQAEKQQDLFTGIA